MVSSPPRLALEAITKTFGAVVANAAVDLVVAPGEIHALVGENGAGKSTLVKIISGALAPDGGRVHWDGQPVAIPHPRAARQLGIALVFQHFALFDTLTVAENIALGLDTWKSPAAFGADISAVAQNYGLPVDPRRRVADLSTGERQRVEIVRCLLQNPKLLIMDEPTAVLTPAEVAPLFAVLRRLAAEGCSVLYITHKLDEVQALCHRATVLRRGRVVGRLVPRHTTSAHLAQLMTGGEEGVFPRAPAEPTPAEEVVLRVQNLSLSPKDPFGMPLCAVELAVQRGEIVAIAGVAGNGQEELIAALGGERPTAPETVTLAGRPVGHWGPLARQRLGLRLVPEERLDRGAVRALSLRDNALLTGQAFTSRWGGLRRSKAAAFTADVNRAFQVVAPSVDTLASRLSGGNLQKFIVGREVLHHPQLLVVAYPTRGVDVAAAATIHRALQDLKAKGAGIVVFSEELDELLSLGDRIAVLHRGRLSPPVAVATTDATALGLLMGGEAPR